MSDKQMDKVLFSMRRAAASKTAGEFFLRYKEAVTHARELEGYATLSKYIHAELTGKKGISERDIQQFFDKDILPKSYLALLSKKTGYTATEKQLREGLDHSRTAFVVAKMGVAELAVKRRIQSLKAEDESELMSYGWTEVLDAGVSGAITGGGIGASGGRNVGVSLGTIGGAIVGGIIATPAAPGLATVEGAGIGGTAGGVILGGAGTVGGAIVGAIVGGALGAGYEILKEVTDDTDKEDNEDEEASAEPDTAGENASSDVMAPADPNHPCNTFSQPIVC